MNKQKLIALMDELESLEDLQIILDRIMSYKEHLSEISYNKLNSKQKIWLLAFDGSENKISTSSKQSIIDNIFLLKDTIIDIEKKPF